MNHAIYRPLGELFALAAMFMMVFQLVTRLTAYTFMFHQGVVLLSSVLIGAGIAMITFLVVPNMWRERVVPKLPYIILISWLLYIFLYFATQSFFVHFVILAVLFGTFFLLITQLIHIAPNQFTAIELAGSFLGVVGLVGLSHFVLEEWLILGVTVIMIGYVFMTSSRYLLWGSRGILLLSFVIVTLYPLLTHPLPQLITCPDARATYKIACLKNTDTFTLVDSIPNIKGRSDVYFNTGSASRRLTVYNSGLHSGTSLVREEYLQLPYSYHEVEIPPLAYRPHSTVVTAGASTGSNVQTFQKYIPDAQVIAVEIDTIIKDLYKIEAYQDFLPKPESFQFVYKDARTFFDTSTSTYDVISMMVESVNTTLAPYVDESTSLVYTTEALRTYVEALAPGGYLLLQQFHTHGDSGDAMIHKVLASLEQAVVETISHTLADNVLLYSYAFNPDPDAQQFLTAVYKPDGFTDADLRIFNNWVTAMKHLDPSTYGSGALITVLHTPDGGVHYSSYFNPDRRAALSKTYNTSLITDDKPFRHLVTTLPFPVQYYVGIGFSFVFMLLLVLGIAYRRIALPIGYASTAFILGVLTFGLQYVLYYKTAAFLGTSLIFFSVFLLIPLLFGAIGGYLSQIVRPWAMLLLIVANLAVVYLLLSNTVYSLSPYLVFLLIASLFVFSGMVFPLLLARSIQKKDRSVLYALNMCGGGVATIIIISLHAVIGWNYLFGGLIGSIYVCLLVLYVKFVRG